MKEKIKKRLFVGCVNGESSLTNKKAKTYIRAKNQHEAALGLMKRYMKKFGKANVTDLFEVYDDGTKARVLFKIEKRQ